MKKQLLIIATLVSLGSAQAVVRPQLPGGGEILDESCGILNRSVTVCVATAQNSNEKYIAIKHFNRSRTYVPATEEVVSRAGATTIVLKGRAAIDIGEGTLQENQYVLKITKGVRPGLKAKGKFSENGVESGVEMEMRSISYPQ